MHRQYTLATNNVLGLLPAVFVLELLRKNSHLGIPSDFYFAFDFFVLFKLFYNGSLLFQKGKELKNTEVPILSLRKRKEYLNKINKIDINRHSKKV